MNRVLRIVALRLIAVFDEENTRFTTEGDERSTFGANGPSREISHDTDGSGSDGVPTIKAENFPATFLFEGSALGGTANDKISTSSGGGVRRLLYLWAPLDTADALAVEVQLFDGRGSGG